MNEFDMIRLVEAILDIQKGIKDLNYKMDGFIAKQEALMPSLEYDDPERVKQIKAMDRMMEIESGYNTIHEDAKTKTVERKKKVKKYENILIKKETEKAMLLEDEEGFLAWIPKKAVETKDVDEDNIGIVYLADWFIEKIQWKEAKKE